MWVRTRGDLPGHSDKTACGFPAARNRAGCRSGCRKHRRWPCRPQLSHLYFQHRGGSALCFGDQTYRCLGTGRSPAQELSSRDRCSSCIRRCHRCWGPHSPRSWRSSFLRWRGQGFEQRSCSRLQNPAWFSGPGGQSLERSRRARRGSGTEPAAVGSGRSCSGCL